MTTSAVSQTIDGVTVTTDPLLNMIYCKGPFGNWTYPRTTEPYGGMSDIDIEQRQVAQLYLDQFTPATQMEVSTRFRIDGPDDYLYSDRCRELEDSLRSPNGDWMVSCQELQTGPAG